MSSLPLSAATAAAKSVQSCLTLCDPIDGSPPGSPVPGILQARTLEWVAISFSNAWKWKVKVESLSRVRLLATPWTAAVVSNTRVCTCDTGWESCKVDCNTIIEVKVLWIQRRAWLTLMEGVEKFDIWARASGMSRNSTSIFGKEEFSSSKFHTLWSTGQSGPPPLVSKTFLHHIPVQVYMLAVVAFALQWWSEWVFRDHVSHET